MAGANEVTLKLLADAKDLLAKLFASVDGVNKYSKAVDSASNKKLTLDTEAAQKQIKSLEDLISRLQEKLSKKDALSIKIDAAALTKGLSDAEKAVAKAEGLVTKHLRKIETEAKRNIFGGVDESARKANRALTAEFNSLTRNFDSAVNRLNQASRRAGFDPLSDSARKLRENIRLAAEDLVAFGSKAQKAVGIAGPALDAFNGKIKQAQVSLKQFSAEAPIKPSFFENISAAKVAIAAFVSALAIKPLIDFGKAAFDVAVQMEALTNRFQGLLGDERGSQELDNLRRVADSLGVSFLSLTNNFGQFAVAAEGAGLTVQQSRDTFEAIASAIRAFGLNTQDADRVFRAFTQVLQKGKFGAEEVNQQLAEFFPIMKLLAESTGKTTAELADLQKTSGIAAKEILGLGAAMLEFAGPAVLKNVESVQANFARFENLLVRLKVAFGKDLLPGINELLAALIKTGADGESALTKIGDVLGTIAKGAALTVEALNDFDTSRARAVIKLLEADAVDAFAGMTRAFRSFMAQFAAFSPAVAAALALTAKSARNTIKELEALSEAARGQARGILDAYDAQKSAADEVANSQEDLRDRLVAASAEARDKQIEDSKSLTAAQKEEFAERKRDFEDYRNFLISKAGNVTEAEKSELAKRLKAYKELQKELVKQGEELSDSEAKRLEKLRAKHEEFASDLIDLYQSAQAKIPTLTPSSPDTPAGQPASVVNPEDSKKLEDLRRQLQSLREEKERLAAQPTFSIEDSNRLGEIGGEIATLESQLGTLATSFGQTGQTIQQFNAQQSANMAAFSAKFLESINKLVTGNQEFRDGFKSLPPAAQAAAERIIETYRSIATNGKAFAGDSILFLRDILKALNDTGAGSSDLAATMLEAFNRITNNVDPVKASLDALKTPIDASKAAASAAIPIYDAAGNAIASIGGKADEAAGKITTASGKVIEIGQKKTPDTAKESIADIGTTAAETATKVTEAKKPVADFGNVIGTASTKVDEAGTAADKLSTALSTLPGYLQAIVDIVPALSPAMQTLATAFSTNEGPVGNIVSLFLELDSHLLAIAENAPKVVTAVQGLAEAGKAEGTDGGISKLATAFADLLESVGPVAADLDKAKTALEGILTIAKDTPKAIEELNKAFKEFDVTEFVKDAEAATKAIGEANVELGKGKTATEGWATALGQVKTGLDGSLTALREIKTVAGEFATIANETLVPALQDMAREFGTIGIEAPKLGKLLEFVVKEGAEGIRDLTKAIKELAIAMREDAVPAANELATAMSNIKLP